MRYVPRQARHGTVALVFMLLTACGAGDRIAPHGSVNEPLSRVLVVSAPLYRSGALSGTAAGDSLVLKSSAVSEGDSLVYVSLPPGSVPGGDNATVRDLSTGQIRTAPMLDGGFDPVPLPAHVGDTLDVEIHRGGVVIATMMALVPPHRPPL